MKKSKIILPVLTGACLASSIIPLASCGNNQEAEEVKEAKKEAVDTVNNWADEFVKLNPDASENLEKSEKLCVRSVVSCKNVAMVKAATKFSRSFLCGISRQPEIFDKVKEVFDKFDDLRHEYDNYVFSSSIEVLTGYICGVALQPEAYGKMKQCREMIIARIKKATSETQAVAYANAANGCLMGIARQPEAEGAIKRSLALACEWIDSPIEAISTCYGHVTNALLMSVSRQPEAEWRMDEIIFNTSYDANLPLSLAQMIVSSNSEESDAYIELLTRYYSSILIYSAIEPASFYDFSSQNFVATHNMVLKNAQALSLDKMVEELKVFSLCNYRIGYWKPQGGGSWDQFPNQLRVVCQALYNYLAKCTTDAQVKAMSDLFVEFAATVNFVESDFMKAREQLYKSAEEILSSSQLTNNNTSSSNEEVTEYEISATCEDEEYGPHLSLDNTTALQDEQAHTRLYLVNVPDPYENCWVSIKMGDKQLIPGFDYVYLPSYYSINIFEKTVDNIKIDVTIPE